MSLYVSSLNSGSNGNCYYIGTDREAVLVDAGISCRETERRMLRSGLDISAVKAIFISHEHTDHIRGVEVLSRKHRIPVYITDPTRKYGGLQLVPELVRTFSAGEAIRVGSLEVLGFRKNHDAADPHSFLISSQQGTRIGVFTDIGQVCRELISVFSACHAAFLETNYDVELLRTGPYPPHLKKRISGGQGHLSNDEALKLFLTYRRPDLSHLFLSHLSAENNSPILVKDLFEKHAGDTRVIVAGRYEESAVYHVAGNSKQHQFAVPAGAGMQISLF